MPRRPGPSTLPPPLEMCCLGALWELREATVRDVAAALSDRHKLAYTTVMTLLERLVRRNHAIRRKNGRSYVYAPAQDPAVLREAALQEFTALYFSGSRDRLRQWLDAPATAPVKTQEQEPRPIDTALL